MKKLSIVIIVTALVTMSSFGQNTYPDTTKKTHRYDTTQKWNKDKDQYSQKDTQLDQFVNSAAKNSMLYVKLGELAQQKSSSEEVKNLAKEMVQYHTQANQNLQQIASSMDVEVPQNLEQKDEQKLQELRQKSGEEFDKAFLNQAIEGQQEEISDLKQAKQKDLKNQKLENWIDQSIPVLEQHLQMARSIEDNSGKSDRMRR